MMTMINEIHIGDNTHHHDQSIMSVSLSTMNAICRSPTNPIPPVLLEDDELDIIRVVILLF